MWIRPSLFLVFAVELFLIAGCGGSTAPRKRATVPVQGEVLIDGKPPSGVMVVAVPIAGIVDEEMDGEFSTAHAGGTDTSGTFMLSTYSTNDGVPAGEYGLLFHWGGAPANLKNDAKSFNKRYRNSAKSTIKLKVVGRPVDMGKIELTSK